MIFYSTLGDSKSPQQRLLDSSRDDGKHRDSSARNYIRQAQPHSVIALEVPKLMRNHALQQQLWLTALPSRPAVAFHQELQGST